MSFYFNGSQANVVITGGLTITPVAPTPSATQSVINVVTQGNGASQNAYTVTAGKTFYLFGVWVEPGVSASTFANNAGTTILKVGSTAGTDIGRVHTFATPIASFTAGQNVKCTTTNGFYYGIWGIEQ